MANTRILSTGTCLSAASDGFLEAINTETDFIRKQEIEEQLLRYFRFDTEAMVEIVSYFKKLEDSARIID